MQSLESICEEYPYLIRFSSSFDLSSKDSVNYLCKNSIGVYQVIHKNMCDFYKIESLIK